MSDANKTYPVPAGFAANANLTPEKYREMYAASIADPEAFWGEHGKRLDWMTPYTTVKDVSWETGDLHVKWYSDGVLNVSANCIDRHLTTRGDKAAFIWEGDDPSDTFTVTYKQLHVAVSKFANVLKELGVKKGDRVTIYMPMILEATYAMLACARIGAVHSVVFGGFSPEALAGRIVDCKSEVLITADEGLRGGRKVPLKVNADAAAKIANGMVKKMLVVRRTGADIAMTEGRDHWLHEIGAEVSADCPPEPMSAEDPLFILYTSGSTGQPKGVLHTTGGYLVWASMTHEYVFDLKEDDVFWCSADVGWVTGHTYIVYGPLANGATSVLFEGVPTYPDASRFWQACDKHQVTIFYTAPTAIRALMREGEVPVQKTSRKSIRLLGTVGEPINPEAWEWYFHVVGETRCPIVDTWWQTETGGTMIVPLPGATDMKPGAGSHPFFGIKPILVDAEGNTLEGA
ncbi:MAG: acetate--CoA ligase, partial [Alphaproteobacteria bacterium]|nr:acetate--CoA ligase [Alphaproteobacteria bacterium]